MRLASESHDNEDNMNRLFGVFGQGAASFLLLCSCVFAQDRTDVLFTAADEIITPNIVFLMADDWSWPHAGAYGDAVVKTPTFDRIAREGVLFNNAHVSAPSCTPSRMAIVTGQHHWRLNEAANLGGSLDKDVEVYPELLQAVGYRIGYARKGAGPSKHEYTGRDPFGPKFKSFAEFYNRREPRRPFCFWYGAGEPHRPYRYGEGAKSGIDPRTVKLPACLPDNETVRNDFADYLHRIQMYDAFCGHIIAMLKSRMNWKTPSSS
jgi:N-sulfoglucosamine sulfohydrolase